MTNPNIHNAYLLFIINDKNREEQKMIEYDILITIQRKYRQLTSRICHLINALDERIVLSLFNRNIDK